MTRRPAPHEPARDVRRPDRLRDDARANPACLGCGTCPDHATCGGLHTEAPVFDCDAFCTCADRDACDTVCRNRPVDFVDHVQEVGGFDLGNTPRTQARAVSALPPVVPLIGHGYRREAVLQEPVVAVPLYELFHMGTGEPLVRDRVALARRFLIPQAATVIASGVDRDPKLEAWWGFRDRGVLTSTLRDLRIALVTAPNFSSFLDVPRPDNLHGMKRIALSWAEMSAAGVPAALHVNARTERDYERWTAFVRERPEVGVVSFEFGTGAGDPGRVEWHVERLRALAGGVDRPLDLVVRGGARFLRRLRDRFASVTLVETDAFMRTMKRGRAEVAEPGRLRWRRVRTPLGAPLDELLAHNVATVRAALVDPVPLPRRQGGSAGAAVRQRTLTVRPGSTALWPSSTRP